MQLVPVRQEARQERQHQRDPEDPERHRLVVVEVDAVRMFFGAEPPGGFGQYSRVASLGRYTPNVTVAQKVLFDECPLPAAQFPGCIVQRGDINSLVAGLDMMRETIKRAKANGTDFSKLDVNGKKGVPDCWADDVRLLKSLGLD